jgi:putative hydroxymethylpyrimidine transport system substrate-binding protein
MALERAVQYMVNHPDRGWQAFIADRPELDDELNRRAWADTLPRFALRPGALDHGRYQRFGEFMATRGLIPEALNVGAYALELPSP